jgi:hypothetical protein
MYARLVPLEVDCKMTMLYTFFRARQNGREGRRLCADAVSEYQVMVLVWENTLCVVVSDI